MKMNNAKKATAVPRKPQVETVTGNVRAKRGILARLKDFLCAIPEYPLLTASVFFWFAVAVARGL